MIYDAVTISAVQQSDSVIHTYTFFFYIFHYDLSQDIEYISLCSTEGFLGSLNGTESARSVGDLGLILGSGRSPREGKPPPVFLPGEFHGQRRLRSYSSWNQKESDMTERLILWSTAMVLCGRIALFIHSMYHSLCLPISNSQSTPP